MLTSELRNSAMARSARDFAKQMQTLGEVCDQIEKVENRTGLDLVKSSYISGQVDVQREQLPDIRRAVGKLKVTGRYPAWDYDRTGEIFVDVQSVCKEFEKLTFRYRTKLRGHKCRVEEHVSTYKTLVCKA